MATARTSSSLGWITRYADVLSGIVIGSLLGAEYLTDGSLSATELTAGCAVSLSLGVLVTLRHRLPLVLLGATAFPIAIRALLPAGGDGVVWGIVSLLAIYTGAAEREDLLEERTMVLERGREEDRRRAVEEERTRIARELHDVVGHALGVIVLQADGGRRVLEAEPAETERALMTIERTGR